MAIVEITVVILLGLVQSIDCDCNQKYLVRSNDEILITSPNYPRNFNQHTDCYYELSTISGDVGAVLFVDVVDVTLNCGDNQTQLNVYDGFSRHPRFLGQVCQGGQVTFESPKHTLYLIFRSQAGNLSRGFRLRVRAEPKFAHCYTQTTKVIDVASSPGVITSPFYPYETDANVNCRWLLKAPEGSGVSATLLAADMRGSRRCHNFGLYVYDGKTTYDDRLMATVCDNSVKTFQSSGPYLLIVFTSGAMVYRSGGGIKLEYSVTDLDSEGEQVIGQTLFFIITALLLAIIIAVSTVAALKLFLLPRRRKQEERRRREARARLTRVSTTESQSDLLPPYSDHSNVSSCASVSSCESTSSSSAVDPVPVSQSSVSSVSRWLHSRYGLKRSRRERGGRCGGAVPVCGYRRDNRDGVVFGLPGLPEFQDSYVPHELPPSYEEAMAHPAGLPVVVNDAALQDTDSRQSDPLSVSVVS